MRNCGGACIQMYTCHTHKQHTSHVHFIHLNHGVKQALLDRFGGNLAGCVAGLHDISRHSTVAHVCVVVVPGRAGGSEPKMGVDVRGGGLYTLPHDLSSNVALQMRCMGDRNKTTKTRHTPHTPVPALHNQIVIQRVAAEGAVLPRADVGNLQGAQVCREGYGVRSVS